MTTSRLPLDVKELLTNHIDSVGQLEVLLVFFNHPDRSWSPAALSQELRSHETSVAKQMAKLALDGFIKNKGGDTYVFEPSSEDIRQKVENLSKTYAEMSVAVIAFIYDKPNDKLKGFADAFKLKKD